MNTTKTLLALAVSALLGSSPLLAEETKDTTETKGWQVNQPQGEFSTVAISTTQGTWMNVDVSPDGSTLVFDLLGDIYTMPISGGTATALTNDIAWNMQPRFSPDGKRIAFTTDQGGGDNLWIMDLDGSNAHQVTNEKFRLLNSPAWSPDGEFLVGRKHFTGTRSLGAGEIWLYHKTGGTGVMLTARPNEQKDLGEPTFSHDGNYVYYSQDDTPGQTFHYNKDSESGIYSIKRFELETGEIDTVISGRGGAIRPTPSHDGRYLAYISRRDFQSTLFLYDLNTGEQIELYSGLERDMQETWAIHGVYPTLSWTPDNQHLVFWAGGELRKISIASRTAQTIPFEVQAEKQIQTALRLQQNLDENEVDVKMLRFVQVSPDGKRAVFSALGHLYITDLNDNKPRRLTRTTNEFEFYPSFSRDGRQLVYTSWNDQEQGRVKLLNLRNNRVTELVSEPGKYVEPTFSPDGKTVVYRKTGAGSLMPRQWSLNTGLYHISSSGGEPELLSRQGSQPMFGKRTDKVYAMANRGGPALVSIDLTTKQEQVLYTSSHGTEFKVSPDGRLLAFTDRFKVFVTPFVERGSVINISGSDKQLPLRQLSVRAGEHISWTADSQHLYWTLGPELYHASIAGLFDQQKPTDFAAENGQSIGFNVPADIPQGVVAFVGGQVITMQDDVVLQDAVVLVENNKISAVGSRDEISIPRGAKVFDISGKTLMPGLFDAHAHGPHGVNQLIPQQNWSLYAGLTLGVTSIHDPSNNTREIFTSSEMQRAGHIVGPRIFSTGTIIYGAEVPGFTSHIDSLDDAKFHLERLQKVGAFSVKSYNQPRRDQRQQVIQAARELGMMVVPEGGSLLQHNLTMVVDGHTTLEHALPAAYVYEDVLQLWEASSTAYTPTLNVAYGGIWGEEYWYDKTEVWKHPRLSRYVPMDRLAPRSMRRPTAPDHHYNHFAVVETAKKMSDRGIVANIGAHGQREGLGAHWEIWMFAQGGMTPLEALRTATINPAITFGMDHQLGSIEAGKLADLIVIDGNPLDDIRVSDRVQYTMVNGRLYDAESMNEIGVRERKRQPFEFEPRR